MLKKFTITNYYLLITTTLLNAQIYISTDGLDTNPGTIDSAYATFPTAIATAQPGDTIYVRGGVYNLTATITITAVKNGTAELMYTITAYQDEVPILDFSAQALGSKRYQSKSELLAF